MSDADTQGAAVVKAPPRNQSETLDWLSKQTGTEVSQADGGIVISFGKEIESKLNVLCAVSQVAQIDPNFSPSPRVTPLNIDSDAFEPHKGKFSLNKVGLSKLADLAQIEVVDQQMQYIGVQGIRAIVTARMRGPDGTWKVDQQSKEVRFDQLKRTVKRRLVAAAKKYKKATPTEDDIDKAYDEELEFVGEKASTKAFLRCVRKLLSVKSTYTRQELAKPFLVVTWSFTPDWSNPKVAEMMALQYREGSAELYAGAPGASPAPAIAAPPRVPAPPSLPSPGAHTAAALASGSEEEDPGDEFEQAEAAEEAAEEQAPPRAPGAEGEDPDGDPEAWDFDEEEAPAAEESPRIPKPVVHFKPKKGPFKDKDVEQIVRSDEGKLWLAKMVKSLSSDEKRAQAMAWLEWSTSGNVTDETVDEFIAGADA